MWTLGPRGQSVVGSWIAVLIFPVVRDALAFMVQIAGKLKDAQAAFGTRIMG